MSDIQIYYLLPPQLIKSQNAMNIDLSSILRQGDKTLEEVYDKVKSNPKFCRDEFGIDYNHLKSLINSDVSLYANINGQVAGILSFMFTIYQGKRMILLNGLCSPDNYAGMGVGSELINTLIRVGKAFDIHFIKLDCKGDRLMNYYKKFGFVVTSSKITYDSDDDSDDESAGHPNYRMELDLSTVSGGKKRRRTFKRNSRRVKRENKRKNTRRKLRKYKYH
jgi:hypothetical protein